MHAIRLHYRPVRYLLSRYLGRGRPTLPLSPFGFISLDDTEPAALPGPEWVRIRTAMSGICGSDLSAVTAHDSLLLEPFQTYPFTFGHENIGTIAEVGAEAGAWRVGDRVAIAPLLACEQRSITPPCAACQRGEYGLCLNTTRGDLSPGFMIGYCRDTGGGWADSFVAHRTQLHRLPPESALPDEAAVLADPFASALRPVLLHPPREGEHVLVIGAGTIGLLTIKALRLTGWSGAIAVLGRHAFQRDHAVRAGASPELVFSARDEVYRWAAGLPDARAYEPTLAQRFVEGGPSLVYDTVATRSSLGDALALTAGAGRIIVVGTTARLSLDWTRLVIRNLTVAGVFAYGRVPYEEQLRDGFEVAAELLATDGFADLDLVTHVFPLEDYRAALATALDKKHQRAIKVAFRPGD